MILSVHQSNDCNIIRSLCAVDSESPGRFHLRLAAGGYKQLVGFEMYRKSAHGSGTCAGHGCWSPCLWSQSEDQYDTARPAKSHCACCWRGEVVGCGGRTGPQCTLNGASLMTDLLQQFVFVCPSIWYHL